MKNQILILILANALLLTTIYQIGCKKKEQPEPTSEPKQTIQVILEGDKPFFGKGEYTTNGETKPMPKQVFFELKLGTKITYTAQALDKTELTIWIRDVNGNRLTEAKGFNPQLNYQ